MGNNSKIEWLVGKDGSLGSTWNPVRGCSRVSEGCRHCYAEAMAARFCGPGQPYEGLATMTPSGGRWTGEVALVPHKLDEPLRWTKPRRIFVNSMSDLFHEKLSDEDIERVFAVMALAPQHQFLVLTKRPERMRRWFSARRDAESRELGVLRATEHLLGAITRARRWVGMHRLYGAVTATEAHRAWPGWPLPNVWLGVSVEDQATADERVPILLDTPAAVRFVSYEPALGPIDFSPWLGYYPLHETNTERRDSLRGSKGQRTGNRRGGPHLAHREEAGRQVESRHHQAGPLQSEESGTRHRELLAGSRYVGENAPLGDGPSSCVASFPWTDPARADDQSQKRGQDGQPTAEPRTGDLFGADTTRATCPPCRPNRSERREERDGEAASRSSSGNQTTPSSRGAPQDDRSRLRDLGAGCIKDRSERPLGLDLIICGGESGPKARPCDINWLRSTVAACKAASVPCFVKQLGSRPASFGHGRASDLDGGFMLPLRRDPKGGDPSEWPEDLRVREWPSGQPSDQNPPRRENQPLQRRPEQF